MLLNLGGGGKGNNVFLSILAAVLSKEKSFCLFLIQLLVTDFYSNVLSIRVFKYATFLLSVIEKTSEDYISPCMTHFCLV